LDSSQPYLHCRRPPTATRSSRWRPKTFPMSWPTSPRRTP